MDLSCAASSPDNEGVAFPGWARKIIDGGFGFLPEGDLSSFSTWQQEEGSGPCARGDSSHAERFRSASVASGEGDYVYPNTMVAFVFEGIDNTNAVAQGTFYYDLLVREGSPHVQRSVVPDVTHGGMGMGLYDAVGAEHISNTLMSACRIWE